MGLTTKSYTHRDRAFHARTVACVLRLRYSDVKDHASNAYSAIPFRYLVPVFANARADASGIALKPLVPLPNHPPYDESEAFRGSEWWETGRGVSFEQNWLKPRLYEMVLGYRDGPDGGDAVRLAEGLFKVSADKMVCVTAKLRLDDAGGYNVDHCVARLGNVASTRMR